MKGKAILWALLLALALTACGQGGEVLPEDSPPEPEIQEPERSEEFPWEPRRILYEEALEYTNREENNNGFLLAEREEEGVPFLEFTRPDVPDFSLRINQDLTEAVVEYQGRAMTLEREETPNGTLYDWYVSAGYGGLVSGYSMPFWLDLTGDGQPEEVWRKCCYWPGESSHTYLEIDQDRGVLTARMRFGLEGTYQMTGYIGELCTTLAYDAERGVIARSGPVSVSVYDKPEI